MHYPDKILQWNINGLKTRLPRLQALIHETQPKILALQEIKLNDNSPISFRGFNIYKKLRPVAGGGGVCLAVHTQIPSTPIQLNTDLEAVACTVYFKDFSFSICNVYFNDGADVSYNNLKQLVDSIPSPKLILGDVNAKHISWGSPETNDRGVLLNNFFSDKDLFILNDGSPTYYNSFLDLYSHLDIAACSDNVSHRFNWEVYHDKLSSDHFPIFITHNLTNMYNFKPAKWKFGEAKWSDYRREVSLPTVLFDHNSANQEIINNILSASANTIPRTGTSVSPKYNCFWWNEDCKIALSNVKRQFRLLNRNHCPANKIEYHRLDAIASRTLKEAKSINWKTYLSSVNRETNISEVWRVIQSLSGKRTPNKKIILSLDGGAVITDPKFIAFHLGKFFSSISSDSNFSEKFLLHKVETEFSPVNFPPSNGERYNNLFSIYELNLLLLHVRILLPVMMASTI